MKEIEKDISLVLYITPKQAAERYGISRSLIYELMHDKEFPQLLRIGRCWSIPLKEFDEFMKRFASPIKKWGL